MDKLNENKITEKNSQPKASGKLKFFWYWFMGIENSNNKLKHKKISTSINGEIFLKYILLTMGFVSVIYSLYFALTHMNEPKLINIYLALPFVVFITPYLLIGLVAVKKIDAKMVSIPRFLRDVVDNVDSGMDLVTAIKTTTGNEYGTLNIDVKKLSNHLSWGINFDIAFLEFAKNVGSSDLERDFRLVIEARNVGGHAEKVLRELSSKISTELLRKKERKDNLSSNTFTGYISFIIFLLIIVLIYNNLFLGLGNATTGSVVGGINESLGATQPPIADDKTLVYLSLLILLSYELSILSGFLFGLMQENNIIAGGPHVSALVILTFIGFYFFIIY
jgi:pilus assembly protein TadC